MHDAYGFAMGFCLLRSLVYVYVMGVQARQQASTAACARRGAMGLDQVRDGIGL